jgi:glycosyltransferase involved in cell wall biosynthesis
MTPGDTSIPRAANRILYLGWYIREKGVYDLVKAAGILFEKGIDFQLDYYGTRGFDSLKNYVAENGLDGRVRVNGWADHKTKLDLLRNATMLVLPSHSEGIPNVILEAMATKTPIVSTLVGGLSEILRDGDNALIASPKNFEDFSAKIEMLLKCPELRQRIAEKGYRDVREKFNIEDIKREWMKILWNI